MPTWRTAPTKRCEERSRVRRDGFGRRAEPCRLARAPVRDPALQFVENRSAEVHEVELCAEAYDPRLRGGAEGAVNCSQTGPCSAVR